jgi:hypothetical protein
MLKVSSSDPFIRLFSHSYADSKFNSSATATNTYRDTTEPLNAHAVPGTKQKDTKQTPETKRKENPSTTSSETTIVTKRIKVEGSGSRGRVRTADFDDLTRSIVEDTISIYRAQISSVEPFPERTDDRDTIKQAWLEVCTGRNLRVELEEDIFKLVSDSTYFLLLIAMIFPYRSLDVLHKYGATLKPHLDHILYRHTRLTAMDQSAMFGTVLNNF